MKNEACNKLGYLKEKYSNESKIRREGYAAFIRNRKEKNYLLSNSNKYLIPCRTKNFLAS
jgi:hypothetical protein